MDVRERSEPDAAACRLDAAFRAVAASPRRRIVAALMAAPPDRALSVREAANAPNPDPGQRVSEECLLHRHLPVLSDPGYVSWSKEPFEVRRGPAFEDVAAVLDCLLDGDEALPAGFVDSWDRLAEARSRHSG